MPYKPTAAPLRQPGLRASPRFGSSVRQFGTCSSPQARRVDLAQTRAKQRGRRSRTRCDALGYRSRLEFEALKGRAPDATVDGDV
jgi:hypothetical protein